MKKPPHKKKKKEEKNVQLPTEKNSQRPSKKFFCSFFLKRLSRVFIDDDGDVVDESRFDRERGGKLIALISQ